jgi:carbamate kinase
VRIVVALGGNALLRRGEPMTAEAQRANVQDRGPRPGPPWPWPHQLVIQPWKRPADWAPGAAGGPPTRRTRPYPLDRAGGPDGRDDRLHDRAGARELASFEIPLRDAPHDGRGGRRTIRPSRTHPTKFVGPVYERAEAERVAAARGWAFRQDGDKWRRVVPSPLPRRILRETGRSSAARSRHDRDLRGRRGYPDHVRAGQPTASSSVSRLSSTRISAPSSSRASSTPTCS